jgi:hypothetical protein
MTAYQMSVVRLRISAPNDQLRLLEELAAIVRRRMLGKTKRSIMELEGLGKDIWHGLDAQEYVEILKRHKSSTKPSS